ncbi:MAG: HAMP domain-containing histidine kinase [Xanthomonadales bacterium]|nr:HAMP domain-containing histidine kinase [Xanthomonadales bacterium]
MHSRRRLQRCRWSLPRRHWRPIFRRMGWGRLAGAIDHYQLRLAEAATAQKIFFANASHELRTPITALRGAVEVLLDDPSVSVPQRRRLQRLERSVTHLHWLLDALIWIARGPGEAESLSFKSQVEAAVDRLAPRLSHRGVVLDITCGDGELVAAPRRWLETMLLNLLRAVVDQRPPGPLPLHCSEGSLRLGDEAALDAKSQRSGHRHHDGRTHGCRAGLACALRAGCSPVVFGRTRHA